MSSNVLDPSTVIDLLPSLLPPSSMKLGSAAAAIAAMVHTAMSAVGFRLIAVDDSSPPRSELSNVLPEEWNIHEPENYTFRYRHDQSSLEFIVKVSKLGGRTLINAIATESDKAASLDISTNDFVSPSFYPHDFSASDAQPLVHGFISSNRISDFMSRFKLQIVQKLIPGLRKDGYVEDPVDAVTNAPGSDPPVLSDPQPARPRPEAPLNPDPHLPYHPSSHIPPEHPLQIGRRDLDPIPMNPVNPFAPPPLFPPHGGDGMFVGPDHPIFGVGRGRGSPGVRGPWGGDGFLPPMGAPPGARFDPVGPNFGGLYGNGRGRGGPPGRGNMYGPDNDEFMPPGAGDMYN